MASVRAGRDARGAMNDLPIPGQPGSNVPDFDLNTMRSVPPAAAQAAMTRFAPATPVPMLPSVANDPPPSVDDKINRIMTPEPAVFKQPAVPPTPPTMDTSATHPNPVPPPLPMLKPGSDQSPPPAAAPGFTSPYTRGAPAIPSTGSGPGGGESSFENLQRNQNQSDGGLVKHLLAMGIPAAIAVLIARTLLTKGRGAGQLGEEAVTADRALGAAGREVPPYPDDAIPNVTDEQRAAVNDASGGQQVTQESQDAVQRQLDINSGKIAPEDYAAGEKPRAGTPGYKEWFKYRQQQSRGTKPK